MDVNIYMKTPYTKDFTKLIREPMVFDFFNP